MSSARSFAVAMLVLVAGITVASGQSQTYVISATDAARVFARAHALCEADAGRLWGVSLCVPIMLADAKTDQAVTNVAVPGFTRNGSIYRLTLPANSQISTAPMEYRGVLLAQLQWPLFGSSDFQAVMFMHESFHVVQPKLGFTGISGEESISGDAFLDTTAGRIWLRGELHALRAALLATGSARRRALRDALAMRRYRDALSPGTGEQEREQDIMEGLAEGTGIDAGLPPSHRVAYALHDMAFVEAQPSYARSFPYAMGPAYTELLDAAEPGWRRSVKMSSDVAKMAMRAYGLSVSTPTASQAQAVIARYGGAAIESQEKARAIRKAALHVKYVRELVAGPTIALSLHHMSITFNPRDIENFDPYGSIYHTLHVTAPWGSIVVSGGDAMIAKDFSVLTIAAPANVSGSVVTGDGWTLSLATGYAIVPNPKKSGSYLVILSVAP